MHPISFENMVNSITVDMTVHINPIIISVFSSPGNITIFVMTLMATKIVLDSSEENTNLT